MTSSSWLISLIERLRPDLCKKFPLNKKGEREGFISWLVTSGTKEYRAICEDGDLLAWLNASNADNGLTRLQALVYEARPDVQAAYPLSQGVEPIMGWFERHGIEEHNLWPLLSSTQRVRHLARATGVHTYTENFQERSILPINKRPFGVNLIGYVFGQLGIGEDLRMAARAMLAANIPFTLIDFPPGIDIPQNDRSMAEYVSLEGEYAINIFCMTALEHGRYYAERGKSQIEGRYNIGYWPWELSIWPEEWRDLTRLVDEVWVSTRHTYDALVSVSDVPVYIMPMAVELGAISALGTRDQTREYFRLPQRAVLFCFSFDLNSSIHRKNPQACIEAFLKAFPMAAFDAYQVGLVIKVHKPKRRHAVWEKLKQLAIEDGRIHIIENTLSRPDLLALYQCCDSFLSLHRAEGFGRGIAEAMQLGLYVITTGYSGNVDFCYPPYVDLVNYKLVKVKKGQYPFAKHQIWAEVNTQYAAELMRSFYDRELRLLKKPSRKNQWPQFSATAVGMRYKNRLSMISF